MDCPLCIIRGTANDAWETGYLTSDVHILLMSCNRFAHMLRRSLSTHPKDSYNVSSLRSPTSVSSQNSVDAPTGGAPGGGSLGTANLLSWCSPQCFSHSHALGASLAAPRRSSMAAIGGHEPSYVPVFPLSCSCRHARSRQQQQQQLGRRTDPSRPPAGPPPNDVRRWETTSAIRCSLHGGTETRAPIRPDSSNKRKEVFLSKV